MSETNPFQSPHSTGPMPPSREVLTWKDIALRWEQLRISYNLVIGGTGLLCLLMMDGWRMDPLEMGVGILGWGVAANVCYLLGPVVQMYLCWFAEPHSNAEEQGFQGALSAAQQLAQSHGLTWLMFLTGLGFSVLLTMAAAAYELLL